ncbi:MAG TPA: hypothetical protein VHE82_07950, partial [Gemmatimonadaceae bacterium]|nr:hypothetical protein [Gemmatimonadaceae bacterium]
MAAARRRFERAGVVLAFVGAALIATTAAPPERPLARAKSSPPTDLLTRIRTRAGRSIDKTFGEDAPLARALLIADQRQIPTEMRDRYASAG